MMLETSKRQTIAILLFLLKFFLADQIVFFWMNNLLILIVSGWDTQETQ